VVQDSVDASSDGAGPRSLRHGSNVSYASSSEHHPSWATPGSIVTSLRSSGKGKQPAATGGDPVEEGQFLSLLFDRQDYLLAISDEGEDEDEDDTELIKTLDPRLLFETGMRPVGSPVDTSASRMPSPEKGETVRSIYATHLRSRQSIVNAVRIHPNLNLTNLFGNLPFSSSVRANNYPINIQDTQVNNLFLPTWAMMTVNTRPDPGSVRFAFPGILQEATALLESGVPVEFVIETHPNIAALFDESKFNKSGILSKWAASMVHSTMLKGMPNEPLFALYHKHPYAYSRVK
jgi:hypothetical protein